MPVELRRAFVAFDLNLASSSQNVVALRLHEITTLREVSRHSPRSQFHCLDPGCA